MRCAEASAAEPLAGTATVASRFLVVEHRGRWGRDPLDDETGLDGWRHHAATGFDGRVLLVRRPDRRRGTEAAFAADVDHAGGKLRSLTPGGEARPVDAPLILVCVHGRRDRCCAQLGVPVFDALAAHVAPDRLWQSSHHGGHRFAANVLVLPSGVQLGRVRPEEASATAALITDGRVPLDRYRGRTLDPPRVQAADAEARRVFGIDRIADVRPLGDDGSIVELETPAGIVRVRVDEEEGPAVPVSCGADPEPTTRLVARIDQPA